MFYVIANTILNLNETKQSLSGRICFSLYKIIIIAIWIAVFYKVRYNASDILDSAQF